MKSQLATVSVALLLAACTSTPPAVAPEAAPPAPTAVTTAAPPPVATPAPPAATAPVATAPPAPRPVVEGATFEAALAAGHLVKVDITLLQRTRTHDMSAVPMKAEAGQVALTLRAGYNGEILELATDPAGHVVRLVRQPDVTVKETVSKSCRERRFAGGQGWFDRVVFALPAGTTWGGDQIVKYPVVQEVTRYAEKKPSGEPCPPPDMMHD